MPEARDAAPPTRAGREHAASRSGRLLLLASVFVAAICGLVYELVAGALSSYLLGDSVTHFSLVIGIFLSSMGLGAWLSKFVERRLLRTFIAVEALVGLAGGFSALALFAAFTYADAYLPFLFLVGAAVGTLTGLEIPLLIRILKEDAPLKLTVSDVLTVDYAGALAASVLFPLLLVPRLGLMKSAFLFGLLNVGVAAAALAFFRARLGPAPRLKAFVAASAAALAAGAAASEPLVRHFEVQQYQDDIIYSRRTPYQKIVVTRWREDVRLYLNNNLQFSTVDEHRYHESLVHPAMSLAPRPERVLLLGGGDGMAVREVLKYPEVREVVLVDLDPAVTELFRDQPLLAGLNDGALSDPRVRIVNRDAMAFLRGATGFFDVILADLPDPNSLSLGKLYTRSFYGLAMRRLRPRGMFATQATSPYYAREAFWCILETVRGAVPDGLAVPYRALVPSFGPWGFVLASPAPFAPDRARVRAPTRYLDDDALRAAFVFPKDLAPDAPPVNRLDDQVLVRLYEKGWKRWNY